MCGHCLILHHSHCLSSKCVLGDTGRMHKHCLRLSEGCQTVLDKHDPCPHETFPIVEDVRQKQMTPVQRGTHSMLHLGQEERPFPLESEGGRLNGGSVF